jgi:hypothetical protein
MSPHRPGFEWRQQYGWSCALLFALALCAAAVASAQSVAPPAAVSSLPASLAAYRTHLEGLDRLVTVCQSQRTAQACDPAQVGADDQIQVDQTTSRRAVSYAWLRALIDRAGKEKAPTKKEAQQTVPSPSQNEKQIPTFGAQPAAKTPPPTVDALLTAARERLAADWKQAGEAAPSLSGHAAERRSLDTILSRREYRGVSDTSLREQFAEWVLNKLNRLMARLEGYGSQALWIVWLLRALLFVGICVGLVWGLIQLERRARLRLVPDTQPSADAPSARKWQLWLADAQAMAAQGQWREAIHFVYWASIACLESKRLWPADRARTPREYLGLLPSQDPRSQPLTALTHSFERTWYGGREADSNDFQAALGLAASLGVE